MDSYLFVHIISENLSLCIVTDDGRFFEEEFRKIAAAQRVRLAAHFDKYFAYTGYAEGFYFALHTMLLVLTLETRQCKPKVFNNQRGTGYRQV